VQVSLFFFILSLSGHWQPFHYQWLSSLVTQSFRALAFLAALRTRSIFTHFPDLVACTLFSAFVLGPAVTKLSMTSYFTDETLYQFALDNSWLGTRSPYLPGVVFHPFTGGTLINGSLWTLPWEFSFYAIVLILGALRHLDGRGATTLLIVTLLSVRFDVDIEHLNGYSAFLSYFAAGMCMFFLRKRQRTNMWIACLAALGAVAGNFRLIPWEIRRWAPILSSGLP